MDIVIEDQTLATTTKNVNSSKRLRSDPDSHHDLLAHFFLDVEDDNPLTNTTELLAELTRLRKKSDQDSETVQNLRGQYYIQEQVTG